MAAKPDDTLGLLSRLSEEHEVLLLRRQAIMQMQKHKRIEDSSRSFDQKKAINDINKRNKKLLDEIGDCERVLKDSKYSASENRLEILREQYFDLIKEKCPTWLQEIESQLDNHTAVDQ